MDTLQRKEMIKSFIVGRLAKKNEHMDIGYDDNLIVSGIVDSLGIIQLIDYLERTFSIRIKDEDMVPENFETVDCIDHYLHKIH